MSPFPSLAGLEPTRATLHNYAHAIGVVPRLHGIAHPKWWHISLKVSADGLTSDNIPLPGGGILTLKQDLINHQIVIAGSSGKSKAQSMTAGLTGTQMGDWVINTAAEFGLSGDFDRTKFESDDPRPYDPEKATAFFTALVNADAMFKTHKAALDGKVGPVQLWPHGYDLAFEWYGTRVETYEEHGEVTGYPSQLNLGFYPGGDNPYFYSNPWPFESERLISQPLPEGASWHTDGWQGTILPYSELAGAPNGKERLLAFAQAVYKIAAPTLMA